MSSRTYTFAVKGHLDEHWATWFGAAAGLGWLWWLGVALTAAVLGYEHAIVRALKKPDCSLEADRVNIGRGGVAPK